MYETDEQKAYIELLQQAYNMSVLYRQTLVNQYNFFFLILFTVINTMGRLAIELNESVKPIFG